MWWPLYQKYKDKGLEILSVSLDSKREPWGQSDPGGWFDMEARVGFARVEMFSSTTL